MYPPLYDILSNDVTVRALLLDPVVGKPKIFSFGEVPQGTIQPYVAWRIAGGTPENYLGSKPDADQFSTQLDVYAGKPSDCRKIVKAISDAVEGNAYIVGWLGDGTDVDTKLYVISFDVDWITNRNN